MLLRHRKALWPSLAGVAVMLAGCSSGSRAASVAVGGPSPGVSSTATATRRAQQKAVHLLDEVKPPANTRRTKSPPLPQLATPDSGAAFCPTYVDVHRFWIARGSVSSVADAIRANPPKGLDQATGIGRRHSPPGEFFQFLTNDASGLPDVNFVLLQLAGQRVAIRADAIVVPAGVTCGRDGPARVGRGPGS